MEFKSVNELENRLASPARLTREEIVAAIRWLPGALSERSLQRFEIEVSLQNIEAIEAFDRSSKYLTWTLVGLTVVLVVLTGAIAYYTVLLVRAA